MRFVLPLAALALVAQTAQAQAPTTSLTLDEAIALARRNNPLFQQTVNARRSADTQVLQAQARAALQDSLLQTTQGQLELAKARQSVGAGTILDVRRAEVAMGTAEIAALNAHNNAEVEMLRFFEQLGVPQPPNVAL